MYLLEELWKGNVTPDERTVQEGSPYQKIHRESVACMERFRKELSPEGKKALDEFSTKKCSLPIFQSRTHSFGACVLGRGSSWM